MSEIEQKLEAFFEIAGVLQVKPELEKIVSELTTIINEKKKVLGKYTTKVKLDAYSASIEEREVNVNSLQVKTRDEWDRAEARSNQVGQEVQKGVEDNTAIALEEIEKTKESLASKLSEARTFEKSARDLLHEAKKDFDLKTKLLNDREKDLNIREAPISEKEEWIQKETSRLKEVAKKFNAELNG